MLTLAGYPLLLPDNDRELSRWLDAFASLDDLQAASDLTTLAASERAGTRESNKYGVGLPVPNWPDPPPPRLNSLWWPTGASRWARGYFLCDGTTLASLRNYVSASGVNTPLALLMGDSDHNTLNTPMYLLPPRQLTPVESVAEQLWLLPLVDERYWWQFRETENLVLDGTMTWASLYSWLGTVLGVTVTAETVHADYLKPDPVEFTRQYDNAAVLLDAVAASVGQRIVRAIDGTVTAQSATTAGTNLDATVAATAPWQQVAGRATSPASQADDFDAPEKVLVSFPKYAFCHPYCGGAAVSYSATAPAGITTKRIGTYKSIHSSLYADFTTEAGTADNSTALQTLTDRIAADYYAWLQLRYDYTFLGIKSTPVVGSHDAVEWQFGRQLDDGSYQACTRIQSLPGNFGVESQLSQDTTLKLLDDFVLAITYDALAAGGRGLVDVWKWNVASEVDRSIRVKAHEWQNIAVAAGTRGFLHWECESNQWAFFKGGSDDQKHLKVHDAASPDGTDIASYSLCLWQGKRIEYAAPATFCTGSPWTEVEDVWLYAIDNPGGSGTAGTKLKKGDRYLGRLLGTFNPSGAGLRPLYAIRKGGTGDTLFVEGTLYGNMPTSGSPYPSVANCPVTDFWGGSDPGATITVHDSQSLFPNAPGSPLTTPEHLTGAKFLAVKDTTEDRFKLVRCEQRARMLFGTLNNPLKKSDDFSTIYVERAFDGRLYPEPLFAHNQDDYSNIDAGKMPDHIFEGDENANVVAVWDEQAGKYWMLTVECGTPAPAQPPY